MFVLSLYDQVIKDTNNEDLIIKAGKAKRSQTLPKYDRKSLQAADHLFQLAQLEY